jgi:DNA-binding response OmpR family regulator
VLVVDDEAEICCLLTDALHQAGLEVASASTPEQALRAARLRPPDLVIADIRLGGESGLTTIDRLRERLGDLPVIVITGCQDPEGLFEASRRRPVELLSKPIDLDRLVQLVWGELRRQEQYRRIQRRHLRLRELARRLGRRRRQALKTLSRTCADLTATCRGLKTAMDRQQVLAGYQTDLLGCSNEDGIFRRLFRLFIERTGPVFGVAMLCDENAELQMVGRFGVPLPDGVSFCQHLAQAVTSVALERPEIQTLDATDNLNLFPPALHRFLPGVNLLVVPLMAGEGQMIGLAVLYRKGEQPFTEDDLALAGMVAPPTAAAVQKT